MSQRNALRPGRELHGLFRRFLHEAFHAHAVSADQGHGGLLSLSIEPADEPLGAARADSQKHRVKQRLVLLACLAASLSASPALAFKNIAGCDIVAFAAQGAAIAVAPERWQSYRDAAETILGTAPQAQVSVQEWRPGAPR